LLIAETDVPETCRSVPLNTVLVGYAEATWLVIDQDPEWMRQMPSEWWERWCWFFLRELRPSFNGEPDDFKRPFFRYLQDRAPLSVRNTILELSRALDQESQMMLSGLLDMFEDIPDTDLEVALANLISEGKIATNNVRNVASFLLRGDYENALVNCRQALENTGGENGDHLASEIAVALLHDGSSDAWDIALSFLRRRPEISDEALSKYSHSDPGYGTPSHLDRPGHTPLQIGELAGILIERFPPELDMNHDGAFRMTDRDAAVALRDRLINWLGHQRTGDALEALKILEREFGAKYPWLRRPRSAVERAYRQSHWNPIPPISVASLLENASKRLIRNGEDALEGITAAIELFESDLRHTSPSLLEDLWNTPVGELPSPKTEERISDKLCESIRRYLTEYAIAADREVQIFRRVVPRTHGGAPGSEVDVLVRVPAPVTRDDEAIAIPVEVKRSNNTESKTGLQAQLVNRYMTQLGTHYGVFVVVWLDAPNLSTAHRPVWKSIEEARESLRDQRGAIEKQSGGALRLATIVVDARLT
jgi:hypothetical protein